MSSKRKLADTSEDQDWIFSYADLMSLLLCFFILLFAISVIDPNQAKKVSEKIREAFSGIDREVIPEVQVYETPTERQARAFRLLVKMLNLGETVDDAVGNVEQAATNKQTLETAAQLTEGGALTGSAGQTRLVFPNTVLFDVGSWQLSPQGKAHLRNIFAQLSPLLDQLTVEVHGHSDPTPVRANKLYSDNYDLAFIRAKAVKAYISEQGLRPEQVVMMIFGDKLPAGKRGTEVDLNLSRRTEVVIKKR